jgi:hypothetical protein
MCLVVGAMERCKVKCASSMLNNIVWSSVAKSLLHTVQSATKVLTFIIAQPGGVCVGTGCFELNFRFESAMFHRRVK